MLKTREDIINNILTITTNLDRQYSPQELEQQIKMFQNDLKALRIEKSEAFERSKNSYLDQYKDRYEIPEMEGLRPLSIGRHITAPVTSEGVAGTTAWRTITTTDDVWSKLESYDSIDAFAELADTFDSSELSKREVLESSLYTLDEPSLNRRYNQQYEAIAETFDDVSVDKFIDVGNMLENGLVNNMEATMVNFMEYRNHSNDPRLDQMANPMDAYIATVYGSNYKEQLVKHEIDDRYDYDLVRKHSVVQSSTVSNDYQQMLYGLYDDDSMAIDESGLYDDFERESSEYIQQHFKNVDLNDVPVDSMYKALHDIGSELNIASPELDVVISNLRHEDESYVHRGQAYASRFSDPINVPVDSDVKVGDWIRQEFGNVRSREVSMHLDEPTTEEIELDRQEDRVARPEFYNLTEGDMQEMDEYYNEKYGLEDESKKQSGSDALLNVSLDKVSDSSHIPDKAQHVEMDNADKVSGLVRGIYFNQFDHEYAIEEFITEETSTFGSKVSDLAEKWEVTTEDLARDSHLFEDFVALGINQTISEMDDSVVSHNEGYRIIEEVIGPEIDSVVANRFIDGYQLAYGEPLDARYVELMQEESEAEILSNVEDEMEHYNKVVEDERFEEFEDDGFEL